MQHERSSDIFRELHENRDDIIAKKVVKGLELVIHEAHLAMETQSDPRLIAIQQGRIELARSTIKNITNPTITKRDKKA